MKECWMNVYQWSNGTISCGFYYPVRPVPSKIVVMKLIYRIHVRLK